jgi:hypothetical protein
MCVCIYIYIDSYTPLNIACGEVNKITNFGTSFEYLI